MSNISAYLATARQRIKELEVENKKYRKALREIKKPKNCNAYELVEKLNKEFGGGITGYIHVGKLKFSFHQGLTDVKTLEDLKRALDFVSENAFPHLIEQFKIAGLSEK